jgi:hypothetical protein
MDKNIAENHFPEIRNQDPASAVNVFGQNMWKHTMHNKESELTH